MFDEPFDLVTKQMVSGNNLAAWVRFLITSPPLHSLLGTIGGG